MKTDKLYLIKKYSSSAISRFKYNFLLESWEKLFVLNNTAPLFNTTHGTGKVSVFSFKQR